MAHSNQIREFLLTNSGVQLRPVYVGVEGVLTGSMRLAQEAKERAEEVIRRQQAQSRQRQLERRQNAIRAQIAALQAELEMEAQESAELMADHEQVERQLHESRQDMSRSRKANFTGANHDE